MISFCFLYTDVETKARKNPKEIMQYLDDYLQDKKSSGPGGGETVSSPTAVDFAGVHELDDEDDE